MTDIEKRIELEALITEREAMKSENEIRVCRGEALAYDENNFDELADKMRKLNEPTTEIVHLAISPEDGEKIKAKVRVWFEERGESEPTAPAKITIENAQKIADKTAEALRKSREVKPEDLTRPIGATAPARTTETLEAQVDRLARFIMAEVPGEPSQNEGAIDTAIRIIRTLQTAKPKVTKEQAREVAQKIFNHMPDWNWADAEKRANEILDFLGLEVEDS
jgi:hypothetical protein